jgi:hypothetical protein
MGLTMEVNNGRPAVIGGEGLVVYVVRLRKVDLMISVLQYSFSGALESVRLHD